MAFLVSPFTSFGAGVTHTPWEEVGRTSSVSGGAITLTGLDLTPYMAVQVILSGITTGTDDTQVHLRFTVSGSAVSASDYQWIIEATGATTGFFEGTADSDDTEITLTRQAATAALGNASTESLSGVVTIFMPTSGSLYKVAVAELDYVQAASASIITTAVGGLYESTNVIDGVQLFGSSNLTAGTIIVLGLA